MHVRVGLDGRRLVIQSLAQMAKDFAEEIDFEVRFPLEVFRVSCCVSFEVLDVSHEDLEGLEVVDVDVRLGRSNFWVVGCAEDDWDHVVVKHFEELLGDVVVADGVLKAETKLICKWYDLQNWRTYFQSIYWLLLEKFLWVDLVGGYLV